MKGRDEIWEGRRRGCERRRESGLGEEGGPTMERMAIAACSLFHGRKGTLLTFRGGHRDPGAPAVRHWKRERERERDRILEAI
jgi:hypothetical protein